MEEISLGYRSKENRQQKVGGSPTRILVGKDLLKELERRRSSPSVIAKLMGIDMLPPPQATRRQHQEFKDVFEVSEPAEAPKEKNRHVGKGLPSLMQSGLKLKKLVSAKSPSNDGAFSSNVDWRDGLDRLNSMGRNNPLFERRPHDLKYSPNNWQRYQSSVLKAADGSKYKKNRFRVFEREKDAAANGFRKQPVGLAQSSLRELRSPPHHGGRKKGNCESTAEIVVLEPGLERAGNPEDMLSSSYISVFRRSRDNAVEDVKVSPDQHLKDQNSFPQFSMDDMNSSGSSQRYSNHKSNFKESNRVPSDSSSRKSVRRYEDADSVSVTLGEMFAQSDSERSKRNSDLSNRSRRERPDNHSDCNQEGCFIVLPKYLPFSHPTSMLSQNSWDMNAGCRDDHSYMHSMMNSRAAYSSLERSPQSGSSSRTRLSDTSGKFHPYICWDEPRLPKPKANFGQENSRNKADIKRLAAEKPKPVYHPHADTRRDSWRLAESFSAPDCSNEKVLFTIEEGLVRKPTSSSSLAKELKFLGGEQKVTPPLKYQLTRSLTHSDGTGKPEQPSPVSILEPPTDEDSCCSGFFKNDMEDFTDLVEDLELTEETEVYSSSDDDSRDESLEAFRIDEDRDFSYLLDVLIYSGVIAADLELLCKAWHSPGCPIGPHVFDKLERKYSKIDTWTRHERKLLFDHVNHVLSEVLAPCIDRHPWVNSAQQVRPIWGPEGPVETVWQMLVRQRDELAVGCPDDKVLDPKWLDVGDDVNMMGKQVSRMLHDDLLEEVILEFLSGSTPSSRHT